MEDEDIILNNACADLVSLKRWEAFPSRLLADGRPGEWVAARDFCGRIGVNVGGLTPGLFVAWLPDPKSREGYVVILFYDHESAWSMAALFNRACLPGAAPPDPAPQPSEFALPASAAPLLSPVPHAPEKPV